MQNHPKMVHKHLSLMANGMMDVLPHQPFSVFFSNFGDKPVTVPKNAVVGLALPAPKGILADVNAIRAEAAGDVSCPQEDKSMSSPAGREEEPDTDWRDKVNIGVKDRLVRDRIVSLLEDFQTCGTASLDISKQPSTVLSSRQAPSLCTKLLTVPDTRLASWKRKRWTECLRRK